MALSNDTKRRLTVATASANTGNELSGILDGLVDGSLKTIGVPTTFYVETTGNDLNPGTADKPFKTVQAAIDSLRGSTITAAVTIKIGIGQFDGFFVGSDFTLASPSGALKIEGTEVQFDEVVTTSASGFTGEIICNTRDLTAIPNGSFVDSPDYGLSGFIYPTIDHSGTDRISTMLPLTISSGKTFRFYTMGTEILATAVDPLFSNTKGAVGVRRNVDSLYAQLTLSKLKVNATTSSTRAFMLAGSMYLNMIDYTVGGSASASYLPQDAQISASVFRISGTSRTAWTAAQRNRTSFNITASYVDGTGSTTGTFLGMGQAGTSFYGTCSIPFRNVAYPMVTSGTSPSFNTKTVSIFSASTFTGCTTCYSFTHPGCTVYVYQTTTPWFYSPGSNTTFVLVTKGAVAQIDAGVSAASSTELSIDGATNTLATMRAASPKLLTNTYGTLVYE